MASTKERLAALFRRLERRLGIDREGRTVWVWLLPPGVGIASAALVAFMPGLPTDVGWVYRLPFSFFALVTMTAIACDLPHHLRQRPQPAGRDRRRDGPGRRRTREAADPAGRTAAPVGHCHPQGRQLPA